MKFKTLTVEVTAADIAEGVRADCYACPVARALKRATGAGCHVAGKSSWCIEDERFDVSNGRYRRLPYAARQFVSNFDAKMPVEPFTFPIRLSRRTLRNFCGTRRGRGGR